MTNVLTASNRIFLNSVVFIVLAQGVTSLALADGTAPCNVGAGVNSTECGVGSLASGLDSTAIGQGASASATESTAIGQNTFATETGTVALGTNAVASATRAHALGRNSAATVLTATAVGANAQATGLQATALGGGASSLYAARASGTNSVAIGAGSSGQEGASAVGSNSIAIGNSSSAGQSNSIAIGTSAITTESSQIVLGNSARFTMLSNNNLGLGTSSPTSALHIARIDGTARILVEDVDPTQGPRDLFEIKNNGNPEFRMTNSGNDNSWVFSAGKRFVVKNDAGDWVSRIEDTGDMEIAGILTQLSDVNAKQDIEPVDGTSVLEKLTGLQVSEWSYKDAPGNRHVGPMAQDFYAAFGLGHTDKGIATLDSSGIALAAIKALIEENTALKEQNLSMEVSVADMQQQLHEQQRQLSEQQQQNMRVEELVMRLVSNLHEQVAVN
jgi:hypothetical protein